MSWQLKKLSEVAQFENGDRSSNYPSGNDIKESGILFLSTKNIVANKLNLKATSFISEEKFNSLTRGKAKVNDLIITLRGTLGSCCVFKCDQETAFINAQMMIIRPSEQILSNYLHAFLTTPKSKQHLLNIGNGAAVPQLTSKQLADLFIPVPPLPEQKRIAAILDKADEIRRKREAAIAKLDQLAQSIFVEMFGDTIRNKLNWPEKTLADITLSKPNNGIFRKNDEYGRGLAVAWVEELFRGDQLELQNSRRLEPTSEELEKYGLDYGDILFCRSSLKLDGIGFNNVYLGQKNSALFECHLIRIKPNIKVVNPIFLNFMLRTPSSRQNIKKQAKTVTMTTIDQDGLLRTKIILPPIEKQNKFADIFQKIVKLKAMNAGQFNKEKLLFATLQHQAFNGQL